jgi:hypothetical protein
VRICAVLFSVVFIFTNTVSTPALGPTQPLIRWILGAFSLEIKRPGFKADHSPPSSAEVKRPFRPVLVPK